MTTTARWYTAFLMYAELGPSRSLMALHQVLSQEFEFRGFKRAPSLRTLERWSKDHDWGSHVADFDQRVAERESKEATKRAVEANDRHAVNASKLQSMAMNAIQEALQQGQLTPAVAAKIYADAVRQERIARGLPLSSG